MSDGADNEGGAMHEADRMAYRRVVAVIVALILVLSVGQGAYALIIGNRFLLKDALDWGYDVILWIVALIVFGRGERAERLAAFGFALVMAVIAAHTAYDLWDKITTGRRPELWVASWSALSAVGVGVVVIGLMLRFRQSENPLVAATWLSSRNTFISTLAFALVGFLARISPSQGPEIALDLVVIALSLQASYAIVEKLRASQEHVVF